MHEKVKVAEGSGKKHDVVCDKIDDKSKDGWSEVDRGLIVLFTRSHPDHSPHNKLVYSLIVYSAGLISVWKGSQTSTYIFNDVCFAVLSFVRQVVFLSNGNHLYVTS